MFMAYGNDGLALDRAHLNFCVKRYKFVWLPFTAMPAIQESFTIVAHAASGVSVSRWLNPANKSGSKSEV